jgi:hypothetical protein
LCYPIPVQLTIKTKITMENNPKLAALISSLAADFQPIVAEIEKGTKTTQNNYGRYMSLLSTLSDGNRGKANLFALALTEAGANRMGVASAMQILFPN